MYVLYTDMIAPKRKEVNARMQYVYGMTTKDYCLRVALCCRLIPSVQIYRVVACSDFGSLCLHAVYPSQSAFEAHIQSHRLRYDYLTPCDD